LHQMVGHGTKLNRKKDEAIAALLTQRNIEEAARSIGIAPNTLLHWMKEPEFDAAYREAKRAAFGQSIARLQQGTSAAATTLLKVMIEPGTPASVIEIEDIEARVAALEAAAAKVK
jgi:transposase-like protein